MLYRVTSGPIPYKFNSYVRIYKNAIKCYKKSLTSFVASVKWELSREYPGGVQDGLDHIIDGARLLITRRPSEFRIEEHGVRSLKEE